MMRFLSEGVYRCQVSNANGRTAGEDIQIYASLEGKGGRERERERGREGGQERKGENQ